MRLSTDLDVLIFFQEPSSTTTVTSFDEFVTETVIETLPADGTASQTAFTATKFVEETVEGRASRTVSLTSFTATDVQRITKTIESLIPAGTRVQTIERCPTLAVCPRGDAPGSLIDCPIADQMCYTTPNGDLYQIECSRERAGNDITMKKVSSVKGCIASCSSIKGCVGIAYKPTSNFCYVKSKLSLSRFNGQMVGARLVKKGSPRKHGRDFQEVLAIGSGGHPDFTYPPVPAVTILRPEPSGETTETITSPTTIYEATVTPAQEGVATTTITTQSIRTITEQVGGKATVTISTCSTSTRTLTKAKEDSTITIRRRKTVTRTLMRTKTVHADTTTVTLTTCGTSIPL